MSDTIKFSILIVDDEKSNIRVLHHILHTDYNIFMAQDGVTAIAMAQEHKPDLILLDIIMPDMEGYEVLTELKNSDATRNIPVIFITGISSIESEEKGFLLGAVDYITKPFNITIVKVRVRQQLQIVKQLHALEKLGMIDSLTNLQNRRSFNDYLNVEWKRAMREKQSISILMIDIDRFKRYNDTYGHMMGDVMLQNISEIFTQAMRRPADFIARWGGEEFASLLPNTDLKGALCVAETIRSNVENLIVCCADGSRTRITISIGANAQKPTEADSVDDFISKADNALYKAKNMGRNRICS